MKKLMVTALVALAPVSFAVAGDKGDAKADGAAAAAGKSGQVIPAPEWDTRKAGEGMDLKGGDKK